LPFRSALAWPHIKFVFSSPSFHFWCNLIKKKKTPKIKNETQSINDGCVVTYFLKSSQQSKEEGLVAKPKKINLSIEHAKAKRRPKDKVTLGITLVV
jgi:hypothetical protein